MDHSNNAGFARRLFAALLECVLLLLLGTFPLYFLTTKIAGNEMVNPLKPFLDILTYIIVLIFLGAVIRVVYAIYFYEKFGGNIGKLLSGLKVVNMESGANLDKKTAMYRIIVGYAFSAGFFGLGFFRIIKNPDNLGWHDELFNTKVVKTSSIIPGIVAFVISAALLAVLSAAIFSNFASSRTINNIMELDEATRNVPVNVN